MIRIAQAMANEATRNAREAFTAGRKVLSFKIIEASAASRMTGIMPGVGEQIEAIEAEGWVLAEMSATTGGRPAACGLRRRSVGTGRGGRPDRPEGAGRR
jgi:hypothetical protein